MTFIINDKIYDTEKAEKILEFNKSYPSNMAIFGRTMYIRRETTLYRTNKGNWFIVAKGDYDSKTAYKQTDEDVKKIFKDLNEIDPYKKYFEELEEA